MNRSVLSRSAFALATSATVFGAVTGADRLHRFAKPLMVPALVAGLPPRSPLLGSALAAATIGDILLLDPDDDEKILRGATAFTVMQICFAKVLSDRGAQLSVRNALPRLVGWGVASAMLARKSPRVAPGLAAYGLTLATMSTFAADPILAPGSAAVAGVVVPGSDPRSRIALGGILFTVSDALIVFRRLQLRRESHRRIAEGIVLATYAAAQLLLVEGMSGE